jgi:hypothetical protein
LKEALKFEARMSNQTEEQIINSVETLNSICSLLSGLNQHKEALLFARQACARLEIEFNGKKELFICKRKPSSYLVTTAVIAYFNQGAESEMLN